jgi:hypothetical protein
MMTDRIDKEADTDKTPAPPAKPSVGGKGRPHVMAVYEESLKTFGQLYERLAD